MSVADDFMASTPFTTGVTSPSPSAGGVPAQPAPADGVSHDEPAEAIRHRLAEVRHQQGVSVRSAARRMGVPMEQVRREEQPDSNLSLRDLGRWQRALEVPLVDLLVDTDAPLSAPVLKRAEWLRIMKTVRALIELEASPAVTRIAQMLESQVLHVMPELAEVGAWHSVGQRRTQEELGRIVDQVVPTSFARDGLG